MQAIELNGDILTRRGGVVLAVGVDTFVWYYHCLVKERGVVIYKSIHEKGMGSTE